MDGRRWRVIDSVYHAVIAKEPEERSSFLRAACAEEPTLRAEIESLIAYADAQLDGPGSPGDVLRIWGEISGLEAIESNAEFDPVSRIARTIGRYRTIRVLGQGGMGVVYEAEQEQPRRVVALKVIKAGLAGAQQLRRFEQEAEALGRLQHPGIAQIYEAGTADSGWGPQPYFAMELIRGESLLRYAEAHGLNTRERLELMAKVCDAIHHAHQRGIIHRDLKPGNILVDESGQPKVLDFGVAHVTDGDAQATRQTDWGEIVGTVRYMSPEQVLGDPLELDTRSDVYALGVILYELLARRLPYEVGRHLGEAMRVIREQDPTALSSINRSYRGDIETIAGKALEKDKARRYSSAAGLAEDIRRYLNKEPILARPPSATYQIGKFARRNKALVTGVVAVFAVLIAGVIASAWEAARARRAEQTALTESARAKAVNDFLQSDLLAQASAVTQARPGTKPDPNLTVRAALDRAAAGIGGKFKGQPLVEASIRQTIGTTYLDLGLYPQAEEQLKRAMDLQRRARGEEDRDTLSTTNSLATLYTNAGRYAEAEPLLMKVLEVQRRVLGDRDSDTLGTMSNLAFNWRMEGKFSQAEQMYTTALDLQRRAFGEQNGNTLIVANNLGDLYLTEGKYPEAARLLQQTLQIERQVLGEEHPHTLVTTNNLALSFGREGNYSEAERLYSNVLNVQKRVLGPEHPHTLVTLHNLASVYRYEGEFTKAEPLFAQVAEARRRVLGPTHSSTLMSTHNLALLYADERKYAQAETLLVSAMNAQQDVLGPEHPDTLVSMNDLGELYRKEGKQDAAERLMVKGVAGQRRKLGDAHPDALAGMRNLGYLYLTEARYEEAEKLLRAASAGYGKRKNSAWGQDDCRSMLGESLAGQKKFAEAEPLLLAGYQGLVARQATIPAFNRSKIQQSGEWLVQLYENWGKRKEAAAWRDKMLRAKTAEVARTNTRYAGF